jgi:hypothetical protein
MNDPANRDGYLAAASAHAARVYARARWSPRLLWRFVAGPLLLAVAFWACQPWIGTKEYPRHPAQVDAHAVISLVLVAVAAARWGVPGGLAATFFVWLPVVWQIWPDQSVWLICTIALHVTVVAGVVLRWRDFPPPRWGRRYVGFPVARMMAAMARAWPRIASSRAQMSSGSFGNPRRRRDINKS